MFAHPESHVEGLPSTLLIRITQQIINKDAHVVLTRHLVLGLSSERDRTRRALQSRRAGNSSIIRFPNLTDGGPVIVAADAGLPAPQLMLGMAHLQGDGIEQDNRAAYWLRVAAVNSAGVLEECRGAIDQPPGPFTLYEGSFITPNPAVTIRP